MSFLTTSATWATTREYFAALATLEHACASGTRLSLAELTGLLDLEESRPISLDRRGSHIAVVPLRGLLAQSFEFMGRRIRGGTERFRESLRKAMADPGVKTILLDVDSPGGSTTGLQEMADELHEARRSKRIVANVNALGASGAYWLATQAHELCITPSGHCGAIGVLGVHMDVSKQAEAEGINVTVVSAGKYKSEASEFTPLSESGRAHAQRLVDDRYAAFVRAVARGRKISRKAVREGFGQGRLVHARDALRLGMVDRIESQDDTIDRLAGVKRTLRPTAAERDWLLSFELDFLERQGAQFEERLAVWEREHDPQYVLSQLAQLEDR